MQHIYIWFDTKRDMLHVLFKVLLNSNKLNDTL